MTYFSGKQDLKQGQIGNILASFDKFSSTTKTRNFPGNWDFTTHNILAIGDDPASFDEFFFGTQDTGSITIQIPGHNLQDEDYRNKQS